MEDKLINEYNEICKILELENCEQFIDKIESFLLRVEKVYNNRCKKYLSFNHVTEVYYYNYFVEDNNFESINIPMNRIYLKLGNALANNGNIDRAMENFQKSLIWNPVDLDTLLSIIELYKKCSKLDEVLNYTIKSYNFCNTRSTLARYYRNLGYYYLESYQPKISEVLYNYSQMFYETVQAKNEIAFIEAALKSNKKDYSIEEMQQILIKNNIPINANSITLALTVLTAENEERKGNIETAKECYILVYDLTRDYEIYTKLQNLGYNKYNIK